MYDQFCQELDRIGGNLLRIRFCVGKLFFRIKTAFDSGSISQPELENLKVRAKENAGVGKNEQSKAVKFHEYARKAGLTADEVGKFVVGYNFAHEIICGAGWNKATITAIFDAIGAMDTKDRPNLGQVENVKYVVQNSGLDLSADPKVLAANLKAALKEYAAEQQANLREEAEEGAAEVAEQAANSEQTEQEQADQMTRAFGLAVKVLASLGEDVPNTASEFIPWAEEFLSEAEQSHEQPNIPRTGTDG